MADNQDNRNNKPPSQQSSSTLTVLLWLALSLALLYLVFAGFHGPEGASVSFNKFKSMVSDGQVAEVMLRGHQVTARLKEPQPLGPENLSVQSVDTRVPEFGANGIVALMEKHDVEINVASAKQQGWASTLAAVLPWVFFFLLMMWMVRGVSRLFSNSSMGQGSQFGQFMRRGVKKVERPNVTFNDVAGQDAAKREVSELVDFLRHPEEFRKLGAKVPRGVLLVGPPGTGKTLLSRALAGEANVPFFSISGSEFIEMFVGVGASRVRNLFDEAKKNAPSIVFIDEIDSIGRKRGVGIGGGHDEREQTLNQILSAMDGFDKHDAVIVLAGTNRPDVLDPALLRPGRFDRHVTLEMPDRKGRLQILQVHAKDVPFDVDVDLDAVAAATPGFSGADLENLINEAALTAAREKTLHVTRKHFEEARDKITMGPERPLGFTPEEHRRLAIHEAGHTVVGYFMPFADPVHKVSIIPRGRALGATQQMPKEDHYTYSEDYLRDRLAVMMGGRTAEQLVLDSVSTGAENDIKQATQLARSMVTKWGMSPAVGPVEVSDEEGDPFLGGAGIGRGRHFSERYAVIIDKAVRGLLDEAAERARTTLSDNRDKFERLVKALMEEETLRAEQIKECMMPGKRAA